MDSLENSNYIVRKYNYRLETGTVGTDNDNIANILYNINRMEMKITFASSDLPTLDKALGELYFMISDSKVHLNSFLEVFGSKTKTDTVGAVAAALDGAMEDADNAIEMSCADQVDTVKICAVFPKVYKALLDIVPFVLALDAQAVGRI
jgi:hypothetical protein